MTFKIEFAAACDMGKVRKNNEDSFLLEPALELAIVADGMGGHNSGEVASQLAVKVTRDKYESMKLTGMKPTPFNEKFSLESNQLGFAVQLANSVIYEAGTAGPDNKGMGTTLSAALLNKSKLCIAHIGDSRIYLLRQNAMQQLTEDHSLVMEHVKKGLLTREQADVSPLQNILTRALGTQKTPAVDLVETELEEGDRLLFCTDGLFKAVKEPSLQEMIRIQTDNAKACAELVAAANANGGPDNITVILGTVKRKSLKENIKDMFK
jgi:serine/threonine protein phosphatase PrpC